MYLPLHNEKTKKNSQRKNNVYRTFKISFLIPTIHMCELNSCRKCFSRIKFLENVIGFSLFPVRNLFLLWECHIFFMGYYILRRETLKTEVVISSPDKGLSFDIHIYFTKLRITS